MGSPPIGVAKLSGVFMNVIYTEISDMIDSTAECIHDQHKMFTVKSVHSCAIIVRNLCR